MFFFKHRTAYEMRISDWSSDVCSSDLLALATLGLNVSFTIVVSNWLNVTGGSNGISGIPALSLAGIALDGERGFYWFSLAVLALLAALAACVRHSHAGRSLMRSEEHTSELQSLMRISYAVFCLKTQKITKK